MKIVEWELTKDEYEKYSTPGGRTLFSIEKVPIEIHCGYGYYGVNFLEKNDKYFAHVSIGSSCD